MYALHCTTRRAWRKGCCYERYSDNINMLHRVAACTCHTLHTLQPTRLSSKVVPESSIVKFSAPTFFT